MTTSSAYADLVKVTTATTGTGTITLGSAVSGYRGSAGLANGKTYSYGIFGSGTYELGQGVYTSSGTTLTRATVRSSSNADALVSLAGGETVIVGYGLAYDLAQSLGLADEYSSTNPTAPSTGVQLFSRSGAGHADLHQLGVRGIAKRLGSHLGGEAVSWIVPLDNSSSSGFLGVAAGVSSGGTPTAVAMSLSNAFTIQKRLKALSAALANVAGSWRPSSVAGVYRGNASGAGGFDVTMRFGIETYQSGMRAQFGMAGTAFTASGDPSAAIDCFFVGKDAADSNWQLMTNDGTGSCTKTDLGVVATTGGTDVLEARFWCLPNDSVMYGSLARYTSAGVLGDFVTFSASSNLPTNTVALLPIWSVGTGAGTSAVAAAMMGAIIYTGNT